MVSCNIRHLKKDNSSLGKNNRTAQPHRTFYQAAACFLRKVECLCVFRNQNSKIKKFHDLYFVICIINCSTRSIKKFTVKLARAKLPAKAAGKLIRR